MEDADRDLARLSKSELEARITELAGHLNAATHRWLLLLAEFDRRNAWNDGATRSCAHWLNWKCGLDMGAAREKVRVARALESLPQISAAMAKGQVSYAKVRAMTRVATPATEDVLLNVALHGTANHVERLVRHFRQVQEVEALSREQRQYQHRGLTYFHDDDGSLVVKLRLTAESGALLLQALERALPEIPLPAPIEVRYRSPDRQDSLHVSAETSARFHDGFDPTDPYDVTPHVVYQETPPSFAARRADALVVLVESFLAHGPEVLSGGERHQITVHVDAATLARHEPGTCEIEEGPSIAVTTAQRLACDASKVEIVEDERGEPLDVGRKTRTIPPALRRALRSRDKGCVYPGCNHTRYVDGHHIQHWAEGGATSLSNLVSLCRFHHRAVHEGGVRVERCDDGAWRFVLKSGQALTSCAPGHTQPLAHWEDLCAGNAERGIHIDAHTAATRWRGETMDYGIAIDSLLYRERRAE